MGSRAWGQDLSDSVLRPEHRSGATPDAMGAYLRFLCDEFGVAYEGNLTEAESFAVIGSFLEEPASSEQIETLAALTGKTDTELTYGRARDAIRLAVARRALRAG